MASGGVGAPACSSGVSPAKLVHPMGVVVAFEELQLSLQVRRVPVQQLVQALLSDGSDESFDERMGQRNTRYGVDRFNVQDPQVGLPAVELE